LSVAREGDHNTREVKRRIKRIASLQAGKMLGVLYACIGLIFLPFFALAGVASAFAQMLNKLKTLLVPQQRLWPG